ncbi:MAG: hypothetical protein LAP21_16760 [Acidobacteriia bacterium]|nr:hypothetical protein [Terriglobia bacterium]
MNNHEGSIGVGLLIGWGLNLAEAGLSFLALRNVDLDKLIYVFVLVGGVGLIQLVYILPLYVIFRRQGKAATAKGLVIAACVTAFLNCTCWGLFGRF